MLFFELCEFNKVLEFVRVSDIIEGKAKFAISGAPFKDRAIKATLKYMTEAGILLKIRLPQSKAVTPMYGLNLPIFLGYLDETWKLTIQDMADEYDEEGKAKSLKSLRAQKLLAILGPYLKEFRVIFEHIGKQKSPITDVEAFSQGIEMICPKGNDYELI